MHIPDSILSGGVAASTDIVAAAGFAYCLRRLEGQLRERTTALMGIMSAFLFAAQMVNFPVGLCSGHLLGGVLAAVLLGPWAGAAAVGVVLIVQCLVFQDGGITALGANFLNMGLIGSVGGYAIYAPIRRGIGGRGGVLIGAMAASWFAVILASGAFAVEFALSGDGRNFAAVLGWMALVHAPIGLGEAIITGLVVRIVLQSRPDLIYDEDRAGLVSASGRWMRVALAGLGVALVVAIFLGPFASEKPDGLEFVGERLGFLRDAPPILAAPFRDYALPGLRHARLATAAAGLVGTLVVFGTGLVLARAFAARPTQVERAAPDAA